MVSTLIPVVAATLLLLGAGAARAQSWQGFTDQSGKLKTSSFNFTGSNPDAWTSNENYYDGDFADFDRDGVMDRTLGSRYGLLKNMGGGMMTPWAGQTGFLVRGMPGAGGWGEDAMQWVDIDNDGDYDQLSGGNGERLTLQINSKGLFTVRWQKKGVSALNIVNTDINGDGHVDLLLAHYFPGGPDEFHLLVNDGAGNFTDQTSARGITFGRGQQMVDIVSGDIDNDGDFDFLVIHRAAEEIKLCRNDGTGNFTIESVLFARPKSSIGFIQSGFGQSMNLGDIDDDGDLDLVIGLGGDVGLHPYVMSVVFINDGLGNFSDESAMRFDTGAYNGQVMAGGNAKLVDIDYDGDLDFLALQRATAGTLGKWLHVFLNNGNGVFVYDAMNSRAWLGPTAELGGDLDIADLNGDGVYDVWLGLAGEPVKILVNNYSPSDGVRPDLVRNTQVVSATPSEITIAWQAPSFVSSARYYKIYRSTSANVAWRDKPMIKIVAFDRHQDEGFAAPITRHTLTSELNDPDVTLIGANNEIQFTDTSALPGVMYYYSVSHVGTENNESPPAAEVSGMIAPAGGADGTAPSLLIVSPTFQDWQANPRIVLQYADGGSGIDVASLSVSFDHALGGGARAANANIADLFERKDSGMYISALDASLSLAGNITVTLTASISDNGGLTTTQTVMFFVRSAAANPPTAVISANFTRGTAPLTVDFDGLGSSDSDGKILAWEWYFGDGTTAVGATATKTFPTMGSYTVMLLVRDNEGGVDTATQVIDVMGGSPRDTEPPVLTFAAVEVSGTVNDLTVTSVTMGGQLLSVDPVLGTFSGTWNLSSGSTFTVVVDDGITQTTRTVTIQ